MSLFECFIDPNRTQPSNHDASPKKSRKISAPSGPSKISYVPLIITTIFTMHFSDHANHNIISNTSLHGNIRTHAYALAEHVPNLVITVFLIMCTFVVRVTSYFAG